MRLTFLLALIPLLPFTLAAPPALDPRASCPTGPCGPYNDILDYCSKKYSANVLDAAPFTGTKAISCVCGHEGVEHVTQPEDTTDTGLVAAELCFECGKNTGNGLLLLELWNLVCLTAKHKTLGAAKMCWNTEAKQGCWTGS